MTTRNALSAGLYAHNKGEKRSEVAASMVTASAAVSVSKYVTVLLTMASPPRYLLHTAFQKMKFSCCTLTEKNLCMCIEPLQ